MVDTFLESNQSKCNINSTYSLWIIQLKKTKLNSNNIKSLRINICPHFYAKLNSFKNHLHFADKWYLTSPTYSPWPVDIMHGLIHFSFKLRLLLLFLLLGVLILKENGNKDGRLKGTVVTVGVILWIAFIIWRRW